MILQVVFKSQKKNSEWIALDSKIHSKEDISSLIVDALHPILRG
jgi:hypothetical protein